jgi:hypothetical protein
MMVESATTSLSVTNTQNRGVGGVPGLTYSREKMTCGAVSNPVFLVVVGMLES